VTWLVSYRIRDARTGLGRIDDQADFNVPVRQTVDQSAVVPSHDVTRPADDDDPTQQPPFPRRIVYPGSQATAIVLLGGGQHTCQSVATQLPASALL
jgi:hypothetical protein